MPTTVKKLRRKMYRAGTPMPPKVPQLHKRHRPIFSVVKGCMIISERSSLKKAR